MLAATTTWAWKCHGRTSTNSQLGIFIGALCHLIATAMREEKENMKCLQDDSGMPTAFISTPRPLTFMWDQVQDMHCLTLSCCIVLESSKHISQHAYIELMAELMECNAPLHIKIELSHLSAHGMDTNCRSNYLN
jgi:hypothetical protein